MRTDDLIDLMAQDLRPVRRAAPALDLGCVAVAGAAIALILVLTWLGLRPDLSQAAGRSFFWVKASYTALLGGVAFWATERLSRPGGQARRATTLGAGILAVFVLAGIAQALSLDGDRRLAAVQGGSWVVCSLNIVILALPMTLLALWRLRQSAPTRPMLAGFAAGVLSGGTAATVYGLHCPEATLVFVALWYSLGVMVSGAIGAAIGRWALRW